MSEFLFDENYVELPQKTVVSLLAKPEYGRFLGVRASETLAPIYDFLNKEVRVYICQ